MILLLVKITQALLTIIFKVNIQVLGFLFSYGKADIYLGTKPISPASTHIHTYAHSAHVYLSAIPNSRRTVVCVNFHNLLPR